MIYDYRSNDIVQDVILHEVDDIVEDIVDEYFTLRRYKALYVYAPCYVVKDILKELLDVLDDVYVDNDSDINLLLDEENDVMMTLAYNGMIFIENARWENGNLKRTNGAELSYVYDSYTRQEIEKMSDGSDGILIFGFKDGFDEDENCECDCYDYISNGVCEKSDNKADIQSDKDVYKVTVKCDLGADEAMEIVKDMERRICHVNEMMDEMNQFRKLFYW